VVTKVALPFHHIASLPSQNGLLCEFQNTSSCKIIFFQCSTTPMSMEFCGHVPNSPRNKKIKFHNPYLLLKWLFWPPKHSCILWALRKKVKKKISNFACYDLANSKRRSKNWWAYRHIS
jgi:hypothetical protein